MTSADEVPLADLPDDGGPEIRDGSGSEGPAAIRDHDVLRDDISAPPRPAYLPEKFWNAERSEPRIEEMAKSYADLERRFSSGDGIPATAADYKISPMHEAVSADSDVNARLHRAGFSQAQAQLVYDLAAEKLLPLIDELASENVAMSERRAVADHFGGEDEWLAVSDQLQAWGEANLAPAVYAALSGSAKGIIAMHGLMSSDEPALVGAPHSLPTASTEQELINLMNDPRYWRDHDPGVVDRVARGFQELYPDGG